MTQTRRDDELGRLAADAIDPALFEPAVRKAADDFYERLLESVQDHLKDNVEFNIGSHILMLENEVRKMRPYYVALEGFDIAAIEAGVVRDIIGEASFLCDRLDSLEFDETNPQRAADDFYGHVSPSHSRLKGVIAALAKIGGAR